MNERSPFLLALLILVAAVSVQAQEMPVPKPPEGFSWVIVPGAKTAVLRPDGWFETIEQGEETIAALITLENLDEQGQFSTGLTFNFVPHVSEKVGSAATAYAIALIQEAESTYDVLKKPWADKLAPDIVGVGIRYRLADDETAVIVHNYFVADDVADSLRLFVFESPEDSWDDMWKIGETLMKAQLER